MIDKEIFVDNINFLKKQSDFSNKLYDLLTSKFFTKLTGKYPNRIVDLLSLTPSDFFDGLTGEYSNRIVDLLSLTPSDFFDELTDEYSDRIVDLLTTFFDEIDDGFISWWIYGCNFGRDNAIVYVENKEGKTNGESINLNTPEKLYDFLLTL